MTSKLSERIREARRFADLTQRALAARCGVSRGAVALWETDNERHSSTPSVEHLMRLAKATGVPLAWLMNDASQVSDVWRIAPGHDEELPVPPAGAAAPAKQPDAPDVLPDIRTDGALIVFATTPEQIAAKLTLLALEPATTRKHLVLVGVSAPVLAAATPAEALQQAVKILTQA